MGKFSSNISKRLAHTKIDKGYCLICGQFGKLSIDHVPPKNSTILTKIEQRHVTELMGAPTSRVRGVPSPNGSKFKTICHKCNNHHIGGNDDEVARTCKKVAIQVKEYFKNPTNLFPSIACDINALKFTRAMVGHILAGTSSQECKNEQPDSGYFFPLREFVLGNDQALENTHDIYYWFYPFNKHVSAKLVSFQNKGHTAPLSLLSFFPIAFMITKKNEGIYPAHSRKLSLTDKWLFLDLSSQGFKYSEFPFHALTDDQLLALHEPQAIIGLPASS